MRVRCHANFVKTFSKDGTLSGIVSTTHILTGTFLTKDGAEILQFLSQQVKARAWRMERPRWLRSFAESINLLKNKPLDNVVVQGELWGVFKCSSNALDRKCGDILAISHFKSSKLF